MKHYRRDFAITPLMILGILLAFFIVTFLPLPGGEFVMGLAFVVLTFLISGLFYWLELERREREIGRRQLWGNGGDDE